MTKQSSTALGRLQEWYLSNCNGDWEHTYCVTITNIDNPGWLLDIDLQDTVLKDKAFEFLKIQRDDEDDWLLCRIEDYKFRGSCGPLNLEEVIKVFLDWVKE